MLYLDAENKISIDEQDLLTGRSCIIGQTGSGKSYAIAVLCESLCKANLGFTIIDTEGEYFGLRESFDVLWATYSNDGDVDLRSIDFSKLARQVIKNNVPLIFDVSEADDPKKEVAKFCRTLYKEAEALRIPHLLIVEEADKFCPQRGECLPELEEISRRGRKRGLGLLVASQRPALINKAILSQCNIQIIGKLSISNDIDAVKTFINDRNLLHSLPDLGPGEFVLSGLGNDVLFKFKKRMTPHKSSAPRIIKRERRKIKEIVNALKAQGLGIEPHITFDDVRKLASKLSHRKYLLFGEKESVSKVDLIYKPMIELKVRLPKNSLLGKRTYVDYYLYFNNYISINAYYEPMYDLSPLKDLSYKEVQVLIQLLYGRGLKTIKSIVRNTDLTEEQVRNTIIKLENKNLVANVSKRGHVNTYDVLMKIEIPYIKSMAQNRLVPSCVPKNIKNSSFEMSSLNNIIKAINQEAEVAEAKTLYFPFYEIILKRGEKERELLINGLTGKVSKFVKI